MKQIFTDMSISIIVLFFAASIMYYTQISDYRNKRPLSHLLVFLVALLFSATLGTAIGVTTQGDSLFRIIMVIVYYVVFTILLSIALSERSFITQKRIELKKFISKAFQFNNMKKEAVKRNISTSDILAGVGIGIAYIFFGIHEVGNEFLRFWSGHIAFIFGVIITAYLLFRLLKNMK